MNKSHLGIVGLTVGFAITALAQNSTPQSSSSSDGKGSAAAQFSTVDTNRDGRISRTEARAYGNLGSSFATLDTDSDNYLSQSEFGKWNAGPHNGAASPSDSSRTPMGGANQSGGSPSSAGNGSSPSSGDSTSPRTGNDSGAAGGSTSRPPNSGASSPSSGGAQ
jgi:hypothetical protein